MAKEVAKSFNTLANQWLGLRLNFARAQQQFHCDQYFYQLKRRSAANGTVTQSNETYGQYLNNNVDEKASFLSFVNSLSDQNNKQTTVKGAIEYVGLNITTLDTTNADDIYKECMKLIPAK